MGTMVAYAESDQPSERVNLPLVVATAPPATEPVTAIYEVLYDFAEKTKNFQTSVDSKWEGAFKEVEKNGKTLKDFLGKADNIDSSVKDVTKNINTGLENVNKNLSFGEKILTSLGNISTPILGFAGDMFSTYLTVTAISDAMKLGFDSMNTNFANTTTVLFKGLVDIKDTFKVSTENLTVQSSDSPLTKLFKNAINAVISTLNTLNNVFKIGTENLTIQSSDSPLTKLFKNAINAVISPLNTLNNIFKVQNDTLTIQPADSILTKLFKNAMKAVISPLDTLNNVFRVQGETLTIQPADSSLVKLFKNVMQSVISPIDLINNTLKNLFNVQGDTLTIQPTDSMLTKLFKNAMKAVISPLDTLNNVFRVQGESLTIQPTDSSLVKLFKNAMNSIIDSIKKISTGDTSVNVDLNPLKESINTGFANMGTDLKNLGSIVSSGFSGLLSGITGLFIPDDLSFIGDQWTKTADKIKDKFEFIFSGIDTIKGLFRAPKKDFEDLEIKLKGGNLGGNDIAMGSVKLPISHLNLFLLQVRPFANAFVLLWFLINMYKWLHERNAVLE